ncbi:hypothetical protein H4R19_001655 [Coemansia spiralis]|nr:hypothetical protein H4R19_001655 [Coemansia spiralis]
MASNDNGYPGFRRATGKVATPGSGASGQATLVRKQQQQQQQQSRHHQHQQDRPPPASLRHGPAAVPSHPQHYPAPGPAANSAIPAPRDPRLQQHTRAQQAHPGPYQPPHDHPHPGYHSSVAPPGMQQHQQQYWQDPGSNHPYYQQNIGHSAHGGYVNRPPQPAQSAASLPAAFQQLSVGAPLAPRQQMSMDALRRREMALEDEYDRDDGRSGADVDGSLFPANATQVASTMRPGPYGSGPESALPPATHQTAANAQSNVARGQLGVPAGVRQPPSRNGSPFNGQLPSDPAAAQRLLGPSHDSASSTRTNSPVPGGVPHAYGDGFDSSSDHIHLGGPAMAAQYQPQAQPASVFEPSAPPLPIGAAGQVMHGPVYGHHAGNGEAMAVSDPDLQPPGALRPWTASSRSLPLAAPTPQFAERDAPSSSSSSAVGIPPMGVQPSAAAETPSAPRAPTPTAASLEAYRSTIKRSNDPAAQLDFAKYVLEHAQGVANKEPNAKLAKRRYEVLTEEGLKWVRKLAGSGITVHRTNIAAEAQFFLGTVHSRGVYGVTRDDSKAFSYYQQASKAQHAEANYRTAVCYEMGMGTRKDMTRALQFYRKAAAQSNVPAMYKLGVVLIKGSLGVAAAPREGVNWLKRGADNATPECPHALHELALCHESSDIPGLIPDETYARQLYIKAGKLGYVASQVRLGQAYEYGTLGCPVDARRSIGWYTRAAEKANSDAELALSGWYLTGAEPFLPQNDVEAYLWARRAADRKLAKAEYAVGYYYECGIGVTRPDLAEAQRWYTRAAQQGNRRAINRLRELTKMGVGIVPPGGVARPRRGKGALF